MPKRTTKPEATGTTTDNPARRSPDRKQAKTSRKAVDLSGFDKLPENARLSVHYVAALYGISRATLWRRVQSQLIQPPFLEGGMARWTAGAVQRALAAKYRS